MIIARIILLIFAATVFAVALRRLRMYRLKERHMLLFTFVGLPFLILAIWPKAVGWIGLQLQIDYHTVSMLCVVAFLILMIFELLTIVSLQDRKISTLAQLVGIMMEKQGMSEQTHPAGDSTSQPDGDTP
jgi:small-conductance mechanosensitive channel